LRSFNNIIFISYFSYLFGYTREIKLLTTESAFYRFKFDYLSNKPDISWYPLLVVHYHALNTVVQIEVQIPFRMIFFRRLRSVWGKKVSPK